LDLSFSFLYTVIEFSQRFSAKRLNIWLKGTYKCVTLDLRVREHVCCLSIDSEAYFIFGSGIFHYYTVVSFHSYNH